MHESGNILPALASTLLLTKKIISIGKIRHEGAHEPKRSAGSDEVRVTGDKDMF